MHKGGLRITNPVASSIAGAVYFSPGVDKAWKEMRRRFFRNLKNTPNNVLIILQPLFFWAIGRFPRFQEGFRRIKKEARVINNDRDSVMKCEYFILSFWSDLL